MRYYSGILCCVAAVSAGPTAPTRSTMTMQSALGSKIKMVLAAGDGGEELVGIVVIVSALEDVDDCSS